MFLYICSLKALFLDTFFWLRAETLNSISTPGQSKPGSNGNEGALHIIQISRSRASLSDTVYCHNHNIKECEYSFLYVHQSNETYLLKFCHGTKIYLVRSIF